MPVRRRSSARHPNATSARRSLPPPRTPVRPPGAILWLTGLSGAGKSTLANALELRLRAAGRFPVVLDGDVLRAGLGRGLGFSDADRHENIRRAAEVALLIAAAGGVVIAALISPFRADRRLLRARARAAGIPFAEIFVNASLAVCERRDPKRLYRRARAGEIGAFTGVSSPYEKPRSPALELHTDREPPEASIARLEAFALRLLGRRKTARGPVARARRS